MTTRLIIVFLALTACLSAAVDAPKLLAAIALVETGNVPKNGKAGETGVHQIGPAARKDNRDAPGQLEWLIKNMRRAGVDANAFNLALAWNCGFQRSTTGKAPVVSYDYARRVVNIYEGKP